MLGALFGWMVPFGTLFDPSSLGTLAGLELSLLGFLKWAGLPLALGLWALTRSWLRGKAPGAREFESSARLLEFAARGGTGARDFGLDAHEQKFFRWRETTAGATDAARETAGVLLQEGLRRTATFSRLAAMVAAAVGLVLFTLVSMPFYAPVFKMAGSIN